MHYLKSLQWRTYLCVTMSFCLTMLAGCGGSNNSNSSIPVSGLVSLSLTHSNPLPGATVKAYLWPDITTSIAQALSGTDGRYSMNLPSSAGSHDVVFTAEKSPNRASLIIARFPSSGKNDADIDIATTMAAELVINRALQPPVPATLNGPAIETITAEFRKDTGISSADLSTTGGNMPATLGGGLPSASPAATFAANNKPILDAMKTVGTPRHKHYRGAVGKGYGAGPSRSLA